MNKAILNENCIYISAYIKSTVPCFVDIDIDRVVEAVIGIATTLAWYYSSFALRIPGFARISR